MHSKGRILIVEDDPAVLSILTENFEAGFPEVVTAENGIEALMKFKPYDYDLIISDIRMPEMDGFAVVAELRKRPEWSNIPVIVVTARDLTQEDRLRLKGYIERVAQDGVQNRESWLAQVQSLVAACVRQQSAMTH